MTEGFNTALMLMAVGMITVFLILALIVTLGNILIRVVNKYFPEEVIGKAFDVSDSGSIEPKKLAAITAVVHIATRGKGNVKEIKREI